MIIRTITATFTIIMTMATIILTITETNFLWKKTRLPSPRTRFPTAPPL